MTKRLEDETWTSYIARALELDGIKISDFRPLSYNNAYAESENGVLSLERKITPENFSSKYTFLYDTFSRACLEERAFINFLPVEDVGEFEMEFLFFPNETSRFQNLVDVKVDGIFSEYQNGEIYDSYRVVEDLIRYAKNPELSRLI